MTQKEKLIKATIMAQRMKNVARNLRYHAQDYDVRFPIQYADEIDGIADEFLKLK